MRDLYAELATLALSDLAVLIEGETGTGKDLVAHSLHEASERAAGPYVVFDCSGVDPKRMELELLGRERGATRSASDVAAHAGALERARGGTLFLDHIGDLPKELQPRLLGALEVSDVRIVAATTRPLVTDVERGRFREDLYYRIAATRVVVPPLRHRLDDVSRLAEHFLAQGEPRRASYEIPLEAWTRLNEHSWPGNVRELSNVVRRLALSPERGVAMLSRVERDMSSRSDAPPSHLALSAEGANSDLLPLQKARRLASDAFEREYVQAALAKAGGSVTRAAGVAEISRQMMTRLVRKHGRGVRAI